jgi:hypothetical protein
MAGEVEWNSEEKQKKWMVIEEQPLSFPESVFSAASYLGP